MTEGQKAAILERLCSADADTQQRTAEAIRDYPHAPLYDTQPPVRTDPHDWAYVHVEALKHRDMALYLDALAFFYSAVRPTNALATLIQTKAGVLQRGGATDKFWKYLGELADG